MAKEDSFQEFKAGLDQGMYQHNLFITSIFEVKMKSHLNRW